MAAHRFRYKTPFPALFFSYSFFFFFFPSLLLLFSDHIMPQQETSSSSSGNKPDLKELAKILSDAYYNVLQYATLTPVQVCHTFAIKIP